eukprot:1119191-Prorocentrum_minimum.AAC.3
MNKPFYRWRIQQAEKSLRRVSPQARYRSLVCARSDHRGLGAAVPRLPGHAQHAQVAQPLPEAAQLHPDHPAAAPQGQGEGQARRGGGAARAGEGQSRAGRGHIPGIF